MIEERLSLVREVAATQELDAILFTDLKNIRYLCGFTGTDGLFVIGPNESVFLCDSRYTMQARAQVGADRVEEYKIKSDGLLNVLNSWGVGRVGFEAATLPYGVVQELKLKSPSGIDWVPLDKELQPLRCCKSPDEIDLICQAETIAAAAFEEIIPLIRPGALEKDIALELEIAMKRRGAEERAFDFIVASGERGALPHGVASDKAIMAGELVTIDFGARYRGYHSDETVTVAVGDVSADLRKIYDVVLEAHDRAIALVKPGVALTEIDKAARDYISEQGFGDYFGHGLGHGVGLDIHEYPSVSTRAEDVAKQRMVFTIEPGIYIPGLGGVRIEDIVEVTADGCRILTQVPKDYRILAV